MTEPEIKPADKPKEAPTYQPPPPPPPVKEEKGVEHREIRNKLIENSFHSH
jgi:hypothetical protein